MEFHDNERIALFIDGADLSATCKELGFNVDFKKLLELFRSKARLVRASYYSVEIEHNDYSSVRPLIDWLGYNGYAVVSKTVRDFNEHSAGRAAASGIAVELTIDALQLSKHIDHVVLFSGSADFRALLSALQKSGCRVSVVASRKASDWTVADDLRRQCDQFIELADLQGLVGLESATRVPTERRRLAPRPRGEALASRREDDAH